MHMTSGKLLVVDDDRNLLELIRMRLESSGFEVATARDEAEARARAEEMVAKIRAYAKFVRARAW